MASTQTWIKRLFVAGGLVLLLLWFKLYSSKPELQPDSLNVVQEDDLADKSPAERFVIQTLRSNRVVIFSKSYCGFSRKAKAAMGRNLPPEKFLVVELDQREDGPDIQQVMRGMTGASSVPRVFIDQEFIGGGDDTAALDASGKLKQMLIDKGIA